MRVAFFVVALVAVGCAVRSAAPLALHADIVYPSPARDTCTPADTSNPAIAVTVHDEAAAALPGVLLYLGATSGTPEVVTAQTNELGAVTMHATGSGVFVLTAALVGFTPEVRALSLKTGCAGHVDIALKVGPTVVER